MKDLEKNEAFNGAMVGGPSDVMDAAASSALGRGRRVEATTSARTMPRRRAMALRTWPLWCCSLIACGEPAARVPRAASTDAVKVQPTPHPQRGIAAIPAVVGECDPSDTEGCWTSSGGFRSIHPLPVSTTLRDVHVMPNGEVWIVGDAGTLIRIVRRDGQRRVTRITVPNTPTLASVVEDIEESGADDMPGADLLPLDFDRLIATGPREVWMAIAERQLAHWDGARWRHAKLDDLSAGGDLMFGPEGKIWVVGSLDSGLHAGEKHPLVLDPKSPRRRFWSGPVVPTKDQLHTIAWQGEDVWVAGNDDAIYRSRAGARFQKVAMPRENQSYEAMWLDTGGTAGYLVSGTVLFRREGDGFAVAHEDGDFADVVSFPGGETAWAVGAWAWRYTNGKLEEVPIADFAPGRQYVLNLDASRLEAVHAREPDDVWMVGRAGMILHYDGKSLRELFPRVVEKNIAGAVWTGPDTWLAAAEDGVLVSGKIDEGITHTRKSPIDARVLTKTLSGDIILAGCREPMLVRGGSDTSPTWTPLPKLDACVKALHGKSKDDLWAVGSKDYVGGLAWRLKNGKWIALETGMGKQEDLHDVAVADNGDVWLAGDHTLLLAKAGGPLKRFAEHEYDEYHDIAIRAPDDIWIATDANDVAAPGALLHYDGNELVRHDHLVSSSLEAVAVTPQGDVWAVGYGGVAVHRPAGGVFEPKATGTDRSLSHLLPHASGKLVAFGHEGAILEVTSP